MKFILVLLSILSLINCKLEDDKSIIIEVQAINDEQYVGSQNPMFVFKTNTIDNQNFFDDSDIEENTHFKFQITGNETNTYDVNFRLWKNAQTIIYLFCEMVGEFKVTEKFSIIGKLNITYNSKKVQINFNPVSFILYKIEGKLPFIYSKSQEINITEDQTKIEINFKSGSYNDETLFLEVDKIGFVQFENCIKESNNLKCEIFKNNLDIYARNVNDDIDLFYISDYTGSFYFNNVGKIKINYPDIIKEDIYFKIDKITNNEVDYSSFVSFETNITEIDKLKTSVFTLHLPNEKTTDCYFIKHDKLKTLYLSCYINFIGDYKVEEIEGFTENDIHYKYNFIFGNQNIDETIHSTEPVSAYTLGSYPKILDFTTKDSFDLYIFTTMANLINNIRFNENAEDLQCQDIEDIKKCIVTKNHFKGKKSGYHLIHYKNNAQNYTTIYYSFGVDVILPDETPSGYSGKINKYSFCLFALLCFLVL